MTVTFKASLAVVGFIFAIYFQASVCEPPTNILVEIEIESDLLCRISEWETIRLKWLRTLNSSTKNPVSLPEVRSFWGQQDKALKKATEEQLYQSGKHTPNCTTACTCNGNVSAYISTRNNSVIWNKTLSFTLEMSSVGVQILGVRYLAVEDLENVLEVYLRPADSTGDVSYNLASCWLDIGLAFDQVTCPTYTTVRFECSERARDVYRVPNSKGFVCAAAVKNVNIYSAYKLRVVTSGKGFTSTSEEWNVKTYQSSSRPLVNEPGNLHVILISPKPRYFITTPTLTRGIKINCENNGAETYNLSYKCTNGASRSNLVKTVNSFVVRDPKFHPATECRLCVQTLKFRGGLQSEPVCNTTTLFLELPSTAPTITCDSNTCPTTSDGDTRNLMVTCEFPPRSSWNGGLTKLVARYRNQTSRPEFTEVVQFNLSSCRVLLRGLSTKHSYYVTVEVCNDKGCSDISNELEISPLNHNKSENSFTMWWLVILLLVLLVVTAGLIAGVQYRRRKKSDRDPLPEIQDPNVYDPLNKGTSEKSDTYHQLTVLEDGKSDDSCSSVGNNSTGLST